MLYGHTDRNRPEESAVNLLFRKVQKGEQYFVDHVQIRYPTHCNDVARFCCGLIIKCLEVSICKLKNN